MKESNAAKLPIVQRIFQMFKRNSQNMVSLDGAMVNRGWNFNHSGGSKTFKKNRRVELAISRRRKMKPSAR
jgi:hypothetical protein